MHHTAPRWLLAWLLWLVLLGTLAAATGSQTQRSAQSANHPVRFFIDEGYFLEGDTEILRAYIAASAGQLEISGESSAAFLSVKGYYVPDKWEVYWTARQACHMAFGSMGPGQKVNCIPGVQAMSLKRNFVQTWQQAYGEAAFLFIPRSYLIPQQYWLWRSHILVSGSPADAKWVLKANIHRGMGVSVVPQRQALSQALMHSREPGSSTSSGGGDDDGITYHNILVQQYLEPQMVIGGRSSYLRLWLLVTSVSPLRAYLFRGGFAIFGKQKGGRSGSSAGTIAAAGADGSAAASNSSSSSIDDLIVNLWIQDREKSPIWSLQQLEQYLNKHPEHVLQLPAEQQQQQRRRRTFADAWSDMQRSASLVLAAALPAMRQAAANASAPRQGMFEYFGLDFVLDAHLRPWLLEVNAIPSMSRRKNSECAGQKATANCQLSTARAGGSSSSNESNSSSSGGSISSMGDAAATDDFDEQKEHFVHDMLVLLGLPVDPPAAAAAAAGGQARSKGADGVVLLRTSAAAAASAGIRAGSSSGRSSSTAVTRPRKLLQRWLSSRCKMSQGQQHRAGQQRRRQQQRTLQQVLEEPGEPVRHHRHHRHHHREPDLTGHHHQPDSPAAAASSSSSQQQAKGKEQQHQGARKQQQQLLSGVQGLEDWSGSVPKLPELPGEVQAVLCPSSSSSTSTSSSSSSSSNASDLPFACISCLTADDLAALAAAEAELQRAGRFAPVHDLILAHSLSSRSAGPPPLDPADAAAAAAAGGSAAGGSSGSTNAAGKSGSGAAAAAVPGEEYLSQERSVWQKLHHAWLAVSTDGVGLRDLGLMRYYTTASKITAGRRLQLSRLDYVMSAWLRVRRQLQGEVAECQSGGARGGGERNEQQQALSAGCVAKMLKQLVSQCYIT